MNNESVRDFYNRQYSTFLAERRDCPNAIHDLGKAGRRVAGVLRGFGIASVGAGSQILDVGSGLGYYTKALSMTGGVVTGLDFSEAAVSAARKEFPDCRFVQGAWPDDIKREPRYDLIWMVNFSLMNTFAVEHIQLRLIDEALARLNPGGYLVVGWNSDFSGRTVEGYSHWSIGTLNRIRASCGMSAPLVTEVQTTWLSWFLIRAARLKRRSVPIFMVRRK